MQAWERASIPRRALVAGAASAILFAGSAGKRVLRMVALPSELEFFIEQITPFACQ